MFDSLDLLPVYNSVNHNIPKEFYNPVLMYAETFDRTSGYFSARALAYYSEGLEYFGSRGCKYRLIISHDISEEQFNEIKLGYACRASVQLEMLDSLKESLTPKEEMQISNLAYFIAKGVVDIKIAFKTQGIFHDKCGLLTDSIGNRICFRGSNNETEAAINYNYETFTVTCSWIDNQGFYTKGINESQKEFDLLWHNKKAGLIVLPADEVIIKEIIKHNKGKVIVEEVLLKENAVVLDYDDSQLILQVNTSDMNWLYTKLFYKTRLKNRIEKVVNNTLFFKRDLVYPDFIEINELLSKKIPATGFDYYATQRLLTYIDERNLYIRKRAKLGIELKTDAHNLEEYYQEFSNVVKKYFVRVLREKQMKDAFFMYSMMKSGNFSVPGSGKTSSALAVFANLYEKGLVNKIVMIGPKNSFDSWLYEFNACFGDKLPLNCFSIQDSKYTSSIDKREALRFESGNCNLFLFNYESIGNYIEEIKHIVSMRTLLVFDEVHKVKSVKGQRAGAALEISKASNYTIAMTGTPIPNSYLDLYNLLHILYNDEYEEFFGFDIQLLRDPYPSDIEMINKRIQPFFCRTTKKELLVPEPNTDLIFDIEVSEEEQKLFEIVRNKYQNNKLALFIRLLQMESNPRLLLERIDLSEFSEVLDIDSDIDQIDILDYTLEVADLVENIEITSKKKRCLSLVRELVSQNKRVIIWCIFIDSIDSITKLLNEIGIRTVSIKGDVCQDERTKILNDYRAGKYDVLITNPHTLAESVSLHQICHDAIYYEYSYNLVHLLQSKDRIHRLGLPDNQYTQYYYIQDYYHLDRLVSYSIDNEIYQRLCHKERVMLKAIDDNELEPVYTTEEDLEVIFKKLF